MNMNLSRQHVNMENFTSTTSRINKKLNRCRSENKEASYYNMMRHIEIKPT